MIARSIVLFLAALIAAACSDSAHRQEVNEWRAKHETDYRREWVPLVGLFFLNPGDNTAGSAPTNALVFPKSMPPTVGRFVLEGERVSFVPDIVLTLNGHRVSSTIELKSDADKDGPDRLTFGAVSFWVHQSGARKAIRVRDERGETAKSFVGFTWFPVEDDYRVTARFVKDAAPHEVHTMNLMGDEDVFTTEGVAEFTLNGEVVKLRPMTTRPGRLYFIFRDGTSGHETYETARFLYADLREDGTTVLDFNEAYNPPCAFNPYTTCPIPLPENRLAVRILAGEKAYPNPPKPVTP